MKKAKDYYKIIVSFEQDESGLIMAAKNVFADLFLEAEELRTKRNARTDRALIAIFRELNDKWNAIVSMYEKKHGFCPLIRDAFWRQMQSAIPELMDYDQNGNPIMPKAEEGGRKK